MNIPAAALNAPRLVAVCDVLGYSDLVTDHPTELVIENAIGWLRKALKHSVAGGDFPADAPQSVVAKFWNTKQFHETYCDDCKMTPNPACRMGQCERP